MSCKGIGIIHNNVDVSGLTAASEIVEDHSHSASKVYPTLAAGKTVTAQAVAWVLGNAVEIVPVNTIAAVYDIHSICVEGANSTGVYELVLQTLAGVEVGRVRIPAVQDLVDSNQPFQTVRIAANTGLQAKVACSIGGKTITISLRYHTY